MNLINPWTSDRPSRQQIMADDDAATLYAMRLKIEQAIRRGLHEAHLEAIDLELLDGDEVMASLRKEFDPKAIHDLLVDGFSDARKQLWNITGNDYPEPPMDVEDEQ